MKSKVYDPAQWDGEQFAAEHGLTPYQFRVDSPDMSSPKVYYPDVLGDNPNVTYAPRTANSEAIKDSKIDTLLGLLDAQTATSAQVQKALAYTLRYLRSLGGKGLQAPS